MNEDTRVTHESSHLSSGSCVLAGRVATGSRLSSRPQRAGTAVIVPLFADKSALTQTMRKLNAFAAPIFRVACVGAVKVTVKRAG